MERNRLRSVLESLLFVAEAPLTLRQISAVLAGVERQEILSALSDLRSEYESQDRGFRLTEVAGGYQLRTARENAEWIRSLHRAKPVRMSRATLETLAIIAYKQPITRPEIEAIRGVDVDGVLSTLLERRLVRAVARKDVPGRPFLYGTTPEFLEMFNLKDLSHLPTLKEMEEMTLPPEVADQASPPVEEKE
ncbi:MAG: SMC-Scp complex subunit ScpB [Deltaproteobacteria bacterium]|nr:SMC-Scp complex subunit ScpB [Deltaproteobacteria bacterium]